MAHNIHRSRSNTSISTKSTRPLSRASTTSIHSFGQHDNAHDLQSQFPQQPQPQPQPPNNYQHPQYAATYAPLESALLQAAEQASQQENIDPVHQLMGYTPEAASNTAMSNGLQAHPFDPTTHGHSLQAPIVQQQAQTHQQFSALPVEVEEKKTKASASGSATNDKELREMLSQNNGRDLKEVASEVIAMDRTSKAEKSKQLFAMLWLKSVCRNAKTSVPRNRVYSKYAERCGTERVIPLNPASFGKLVRVIFPGIQTRRLGVRGESKYHYVDLALITDTEDGGEASRPGTGIMSRHSLKRQNSTGTKLDFSTPRLPADTAAFPPQDQGFESNSYFHQSTSKGRLFTDIYSPEFQPPSRTSVSYDYELRFSAPELLSASDDLDMILPNITPYLPPRTDPDSAGALVALYRTHCTSLIDSVRYCKERQFWRLFGSFHGTLTVPVQKLFAMPELTRWIKECDWLMYQKMIRNVSQLTLQVAPPVVLKFLDNISKTLHSHVSTVFQSVPLHVLEAKLEPATLFAHLLRQMLRVNQTAHAAAVILTGDENRDKMWEDWLQYVNLKRIIENELPHSCDHEEVFNILSTEIRGMLLPLKPETWLPDGTHYQAPPGERTDPTNETVIDRIAAFLTRLPAKFTHVPARTILHCVNAIGSAIVRELTVLNGQSFHGWWLTKVFVDEMCQWLASLGGFLEHTPPNLSPLTYSPGLMGESLNTAMTNQGSVSNNDSRYSSIDIEFGPGQSFMSNGNSNAHAQDVGNTNSEINPRRFTEQYEQMSFALDLDLSTSQQEPNHDDSGIGLMDDTNIDAKFAHSLRSHLQQLPTGVS
ncbi:hypothetical protein BDV95DRAFT_631678 [Massariosphaeria phaeospora]|uniref:RFX-type winged-helix domain-containing protein n=1 Tax=Massariosphaeria phaeospora TaxID=100035 RepID=A0A7C8M2Y7_9PLEO|nr:hypothetical protein BDV95DRAFT_631678 [Massariosphaeria phaeospora]